ncbi:MAG: glutaredoxin [Treponema sp.]|jgi:arsenate reductase-like glutaredoxin family protein|nr:glutaredoxin [Treponema sp.]
MIQIFGTKKCRITQKAIRFFKERNVEIQFRDLALKPPSPGELDAMAAGAWDKLLDMDGAAAQERGLRYLDYEPRAELLARPELYRTPLVRQGKGRRAAVGDDEKAWKEFCAGYST